MANKGRKFLTTTHICMDCRYSYTVRGLVPRGKEHHALTDFVAMVSISCPRCRQNRRLNECICSTCQKEHA